MPRTSSRPYALALSIVVPALFGGRAERVYRDSIAQLGGTGHALRLDSYRRGWFSSQATSAHGRPRRDYIRTARASRSARILQRMAHRLPGRGGRRHRSAAGLAEQSRPVLRRRADRHLNGRPDWAARWIPTSRARQPNASDAAQKFTAKFDGFNAGSASVAERLHVRGDASRYHRRRRVRRSRDGRPDDTRRVASPQQWLVARRQGPQNRSRELQCRRQRRASVGQRPGSGHRPCGAEPRSKMAGSTCATALSIGKIAAGALKLGPISLAAGVQQHPAGSDRTIHESDLIDSAVDIRPTGAIADAAAKRSSTCSLRQ